MMGTVALFASFLISSSSPLQGEAICLRQEAKYYAHYKPALTLCSLNDDCGRSLRRNRPVRKTLKPPEDGLHICGRLDRDSEGLLLLTNDGHFTAKVCGSGCRKVYWALVQGNRTLYYEALTRMRHGGLEIRGKRTRPPVSVKLLMDPPSILPPPVPGMAQRTPLSYWIEIVLTEGRNRQVRRLTADAGYRTVRLVRVAIGDLRLPSVLPNEYKRIHKEDVLKY